MSESVYVIYLKLLDLMVLIYVFAYCYDFTSAALEHPKASDLRKLLQPSTST